MVTEVYRVRKECANVSCVEDALFVVVRTNWKKKKRRVQVFCAAHALEVQSEATKNKTVQVFTIDAECSEPSCPEDAELIVVTTDWEARTNAVYLFCPAHALEATSGKGTTAPALEDRA